MPDFTKMLVELRKAGASDLHINSGENCYSRQNGLLTCLKDIKFSDDEVKKIILSTSSPKAREILGKFRHVNYAYEDPNGERYRFSAFFSRGKFALAIRFLPAAPAKLQDLGLPEQMKKVLAKPSGLILIGSPAGQGKTTTLSAILEFFNQHFEKNVVTVENPVEIKFKDHRCSFIQRSIPLDVPNFFEGLNEAYRLDPDIVVTDSISYADALDQTLFLCESGYLVIALTSGEDSQKILERLIFSRQKDQREAFREKLISHLSMVICQRLVTCLNNKRVAAFDIVVNTPLVKNVLKGDNLGMIKNLQDQDKEWGMITYEKCLRGMINKLMITPATAAAFFGENSEIAAKFVKK